MEGLVQALVVEVDSARNGDVRSGGNRIAEAAPAVVPRNVAACVVVTNDRVLVGVNRVIDPKQVEDIVRLHVYLGRELDVQLHEVAHDHDDAPVEPVAALHRD